MSAAANMPTRTGGSGPHAEQRLASAGAPPDRARLVMVMLHGRGAGPEDMLGLHDHLALPDVAALAPAAASRSWWPDSFLAPLGANEPGLSSGLSAISALLDDLERAGFGPERTVLAGFSQGACLALEAAARLARPYRAVAALSGGLVGTRDVDEAPRPDLYGRPDKRFDYDGSLADVPVLIGCHERDPHIPLARVHRSAEVLTGMGAAVYTHVIPGAGHGIVHEEIAWLRGHLNAA
ncbi:alpha/beta hydrolase [Roseivivax marinus]|uniref:alpha/beta hydrolase n=1 Tax=Roseivivax marinus TaxID=1379903 RepID=UPI00273F88B5|nr:dienelactone hydrolase family protein [Roseivivax marinus]